MGPRSSRPRSGRWRAHRSGAPRRTPAVPGSPAPRRRALPQPSAPRCSAPRCARRSCLATEHNTPRRPARRPAARKQVRGWGEGGSAGACAGGACAVPRVPGVRVPGVLRCVCRTLAALPGARPRRLRAAARAPVPAVPARIAGGPRPAPPRRGCSSSSKAGAACPGAAALTAAPGSRRTRHRPRPRDSTPPKCVLASSRNTPESDCIELSLLITITSYITIIIIAAMWSVL